MLRLERKRVEGHWAEGAEGRRGTSPCLVHKLLTAKTLSGSSTPEDVASRIVVKHRKLIAKPYVEGNSVKVKFKTGLVILLY